MPICPDCGGLVETKSQKAARIGKEDMKKGLKIGGKGIFNAIRHPKQTYNKIFKQKPQYPEKCNRNCNRNLLAETRQILSEIVPQKEEPSASGDVLYTFKIFKSVWDKVNIPKKQ